MIKKLLLTTIATIFLSLGLSMGVAFAQDPAATNPTPDPNATTQQTSLFSNSKDAACGGAQSSDNPVDCAANGGGADTVNRVIKAGLNLLSVVVGLAAVIMIIIGGLRFITAQGDAGSISSARNSVLYAIVGLVVVALAQLVVKFVLTQTNPKPAVKKTTSIMQQEVKSLDVTSDSVV